MNRSADYYFEAGCGRCEHYETPSCKVHRWKQELLMLRRLLLETGLQEESKWGMPCYTFQKHNIIMLGALKDSCTLSFFKGSLLQDDKKILQFAGENSQVGKLIRFRSIKEIEPLYTTLKTYIYEAIEIENAGLKVKTKDPAESQAPVELLNRFKVDPEFKEVFNKLTPGRQRSYYIYIAQAKQSSTRETRIDKCIPKIREGKGFNEY